MTWREAFLALARDMRARSQRCREASKLDPDRAHRSGAAYAFGVAADELEFLASLPPHEGVARLRKKMEASP